MPKHAPAGGEEHPFLSGGGELAALIARFDWAATPLGKLAAWPQSLKTTVALILRSHVPIVTLWGEDGIMIYNDAYAVFAGGRHPRLLGSKVREGWPEVADFNDNVMKVGLAGGTLAYKDRELTLFRNGQAEQVWMDLDYSPLPDEEGRPAGIIAFVTETTDKVRAQHWLKGEQDRLGRMFEQAPGFMAMLHGPEHVCEFVNPAFSHLIGGRDVRGRRVKDALPEVAEQGYLERLDRVFASGQAISGLGQSLHVRRTPEGTPEQRYIDFVFQPVRGAGGEVVGIFVDGVDVTDRITAEAAIRASEARNRQILDSALDYGIVATDIDGAVIRWNEGARRMLGWSEAEMLGHTMARFFTAEDRASGAMAEEMRRALATGTARDERWHLRKSGERFWASGELTPLREAGQAVGFVKVFRDRTEEHRAQHALRESEAQLRRAQEAGGVGLFTVDIANDRIYGTPEFCRIFGLAVCEALQTKDVERLVVPEDQQLISNPAMRARGEAARDIEYRIHRADTGELRTISRKCDFEHDDSGRPIRMVGVVQDVTERRAVQRALEESEAQFRTFAEVMPNQVWTAPPDGLLDWFNERVYAYSGFAYADLKGTGWARMVHAEDIGAAAERWAASLASGGIYETEFRLRRADGSYRWHLARAQAIRGPDGQITRWVGTNTDIHERKLAEAESARDRNRMWAMSQDLMLVCDFEGVITAVNPSATRLLGWPEDEVVGRRFSDFLHPQDIGPTTAEIAKLSHGVSTLAFENRCRTKDDRYRLLDWTAVPDSGRIHAVGRDITEQRAIVRDQERIWTLSPVLKVVADASGVLQMVNPAWAMTLGWPVEASVGRPAIEFVAPEARDRAELALQRLGGGEAVTDQEFAMTTRQGSQRQIVWTIVPENGALYGFGRDVTEQRAVEDALRQSQKMEAVGQLTGGIAHDFNNLLQGITGSLDVLQKRLSQGRLGELDRFITGAMASASRASALTHRLLAFSRRQPLDPRPVRVNPLMTSMEDLLRRTLGERIELDLVLAGGLWLTRCDPNQLESAILNLAINSRDAMPDGGRLVIETCNAHLDSHYAAKHQEVRSGQYICICVTDTGTGMTAETAARAFEPFFTTKPIGQGTGLGLSMIYGFARQSEGHAKIYSEVGNGTTFRLYLPRYRGPAEAEDGFPASAEPDAAGAGESILVVEDEPVVRSLILEILNELGYATLEAVDGPSGLEILRSGRRIDLLITDVGLPGLNGRQIADAGRALRPELKILFMTGYAENAALASGFLEAGMALITKPFAMELLVTRVRDMLG